MYIFGICRIVTIEALINVIFNQKYLKEKFIYNPKGKANNCLNLKKEKPLAWRN